MVVGWRLAVPGAAQTVRDAAWLAELQLCKCGGDLEQNEQVLLLHSVQDELLDSTQSYSMLLAAIATSAAYSQLGAFYMSTLTRGLRFSMYRAPDQESRVARIYSGWLWNVGKPELSSVRLPQLWRPRFHFRKSSEVKCQPAKTSNGHNEV